MPYLTKPLDEHGAVVDIRVGVIESRRQVLLKNNLPVPPRVPICAQIDTGASCSAISHHVFKALDQTPTGTTKVLVPSVSPDPQEFEEYAVSLFLVAPDGLELYLPVLAGVISCDFSDNNVYHALLGRDVLSQCLFVYDGTNKVFSFAF